MPTLKSSSSAKVLVLDRSKPIFFIQTSKDLDISNEASGSSLGSLYYAKRDIVLIAGNVKRLFVNGCLVSLFKIIRERDVIKFGEEDWTFYEIERRILDTNSDLVKQKKQCIVCGKQFKVNDAIVICPNPVCHASHHVECWKFQKGRCANGKICDYQEPRADDKG
jgi:hypothetical protein